MYLARWIWKAWSIFKIHNKIQIYEIFHLNSNPMEGQNQIQVQIQIQGTFKSKSKSNMHYWIQVQIQIHGTFKSKSKSKSNLHHWIQVQIQIQGTFESKSKSKSNLYHWIQVQIQIQGTFESKSISKSMKYFESKIQSNPRTKSKSNPNPVQIQSKSKSKLDGLDLSKSMQLYWREWVENQFTAKRTACNKASYYKKPFSDSFIKGSSKDWNFVEQPHIKIPHSIFHLTTIQLFYEIWVRGRRGRGS